MRDFIFVCIVVLLIWNLSHAYKGIWDLTRCSDEIATWRNIFDLMLNYVFASFFAIIAALEEHAWIYVILFMFNEGLFMLKISKYNYLRFKRNKID